VWFQRWEWEPALCPTAASLNSSGLVVGKNRIPINHGVLQRLTSHGFDIRFVRASLEANKHNGATTTYYLLYRKLELAGDLPSPDEKGGRGSLNLSMDAGLVPRPPSRPRGNSALNMSTGAGGLTPHPPMPTMNFTQNEFNPRHRRLVEHGAKRTKPARGRSVSRRHARHSSHIPPAILTDSTAASGATTTLSGVTSPSHRHHSTSPHKNVRSSFPRRLFREIRTQHKD
jgi:hypothetical protein